MTKQETQEARAVVADRYSTTGGNMFVLHISHPRMRGCVELSAPTAYSARIEALAAFGRSPTLSLTLYRRDADGSLTSLGVLLQRASVTVDSTARQVT